MRKSARRSSASTTSHIRSGGNLEHLIHCRACSRWLSAYLQTSPPSLPATSRICGLAHLSCQHRAQALFPYVLHRATEPKCHQV